VAAVCSQLLGRVALAASVPSWLLRLAASHQSSCRHQCHLAREACDHGTDSQHLRLLCAAAAQGSRHVQHTSSPHALQGSGPGLAPLGFTWCTSCATVDVCACMSSDAGTFIVGGAQRQKQQQHSSTSSLCGQKRTKGHGRGAPVLLDKLLVLDHRVSVLDHELQAPPTAPLQLTSSCCLEPRRPRCPKPPACCAQLRPHPQGRAGRRGGPWTGTEWWQRRWQPWG
jgi:hypothetical protein